MRYPRTEGRRVPAIERRAAAQGVQARLHLQPVSRGLRTLAEVPGRRAARRTTSQRAVSADPEVAREECGMIEAALQRTVLAELYKLGIWAWRSNTGGARLTGGG